MLIICCMKYFLHSKLIWFNEWQFSCSVIMTKDASQIFKQHIISNVYNFDDCVILSFVTGFILNYPRTTKLCSHNQKRLDMLYKLCLNELEHFKVFSRLFRTAIMLGTGLGPAGLGVLDTLWPDGHLHIRDSQWRCPGGNNEWSSIYQYGKCHRYLG